MTAHVSAKFSRKRKNNLRNIIHAGFLVLCGPKPGTTSAKTKRRKTKSVLLLGDYLKQAAKNARRSQEITRRDYKKYFKATSTRQSQKDHKTSFLDYGKKGDRGQMRTLMQQRPPFRHHSNTNSFHSSSKQYYPGWKYHNQRFVSSTHN